MEDNNTVLMPLLQFFALGGVLKEGRSLYLLRSNEFRFIGEYELTVPNRGILTQGSNDFLDAKDLYVSAGIILNEIHEETIS